MPPKYVAFEKKAVSMVSLHKLCYIVYFLNICNGEQFWVYLWIQFPMLLLVVCLWKINVIIIIIIIIII
jgi:hypothetical protein